MKLGEATVLLVDDELDLREIFSAWLGREGCRVLTAANGAEALNVLEREKVEVLVSDIRMPIMGGVELVRTVYKRKLVIPSIIFVSGYGEVDLREMYGLGVEALMEKPLSRKDLVGKLESSLMERRELWRTPLAGPVEQAVALELESIDDAVARCLFQLGRGGCCFLSTHPLEADKTLDLSIRFVEQGRNLRAQGTVRWFDRHTRQAGMSFGYLESGCRDWVIGAMTGEAYRSFIPQCR